MFIKVTSLDSLVDKAYIRIDTIKAILPNETIHSTLLLDLRDGKEDGLRELPVWESVDTVMKLINKEA